MNSQFTENGSTLYWDEDDDNFHIFPIVRDMQRHGDDLLIFRDAFPDGHPTGDIFPLSLLLTPFEAENLRDILTEMLEEREAMGEKRKPPPTHRVNHRKNRLNLGQWDEDGIPRLTW